MEEAAAKTEALRLLEAEKEKVTQTSDLVPVLFRQHALLLNEKFEPVLTQALDQLAESSQIAAEALSKEATRTSAMLPVAICCPLLRVIITCYHLRSL